MTWHGSNQTYESVKLVSEMVHATEHERYIICNCEECRSRSLTWRQVIKLTNWKNISREFTVDEKMWQDRIEVEKEGGREGKMKQGKDSI